MRIQKLPAQRALSSLRGGPSGLTAEEAGRRLGRFGHNILESARRQPMAERFLRSFTHFFAVLLWLGAGLAMVAELHQPDSWMGILAMAIVAVILINGLFSFWSACSACR